MASIRKASMKCRTRCSLNRSESQQHTILSNSGRFCSRTKAALPILPGCRFHHTSDQLSMRSIPMLETRQETLWMNGLPDTPLCMLPPSRTQHPLPSEPSSRLPISTASIHRQSRCSMVQRTDSLQLHSTCHTSSFRRNSMPTTFCSRCSGQSQ